MANATKEKEVKIFEKTLDEIRGLVKDTNCKERVNRTGSSFFEGSKRFCKLIKSGKDLVQLELNVKLPESFTKGRSDIITYSRAEAARKHLGTMVHLIRTKDEELIASALKTSWKIFRDEIAQEAAKAKGAGDSGNASSKEKTEGKAKGSKSTPKKNEEQKVAAEAPVQNKVETRKLTDEDLKRLENYKKQGKLKDVDPHRKS